MTHISWLLVITHQDNGDIDIVSPQIPSGKLVAHCGQCKDKDSEAYHNAEFIVRACNSHYELLNALKAMLHYHGECNSQCKEVQTCKHEMARQAIAKARRGA